MDTTSGKQQKNSSYKDGLESSDRIRYETKLDVIGGLDPYDSSLKWSTDVAILPSVTYPDIVNYLIFTPSRFKIDDLKAWKSLEAVNQLCFGWVRERGAIDTAGHIVVKTKRLREKPLQPWVIAKPDGVVVAAHCNCMAGLGEACTHIAALLFSVMAAVEVRDSKSVTESKCWWIQPTATKAINYKEISEIDFTSKKSAARKVTSTSEMPEKTPTTRKASFPKASYSDLMSFCEKAQPLQKKPGLLSVIDPFADEFIPKADKLDLPEQLTKLRDPDLIGNDTTTVLLKCSEVTITCTAEQAANVEMETRQQSNSGLWFRFRAGRITASKMKAACVTNPLKPSESLVKSICYPESSRFENIATKWGLSNENRARDQFVKHVSHEHEGMSISDCGFFISTDRPFLGASPDGILTCACCGSACVEVKCPYTIRDDIISESNFTCLEIKEGQLTLNREHSYFDQVQTQMGVCKMDVTYFVVWTSKDLFVETIPFDKNLYENICMKADNLFRIAILPELVAKVYTTLVVDKNDLNQSLCTPLLKSSENIQSPVKSDEKLYCVCNQVEFGKMIGCDNDDCEIEWFHYGCVNIESAPAGKWFCHVCRKLPQFKRRRLARH
ncbi:ING3-like protein [Mya arenaria]|uniref:Inhibitor of growth protein 3 n=1 Tax=Mya arenaria TaxID=6604 RepID=A0ABY7F8G0_MYAAR|nr:ING3-like protein [Mya arenaria]